MYQKVNEQIDDEAREEIDLFYKRLLANLDRELTVQQSLLELLEEERAALATASTRAIEATNARKEGLLLKEKENGAARQAMIDRVRAVPGWRGKKTTLSRFVELAPDAETVDGLRARQRSLTVLTNTIRTHNRRNRELIDAALKDVQGSLHLIQGMVSPQVNYQKTGRLSLKSTQGSFINREG